MSIQTEIQDKLTQIEKDHKVIILYACESGSRAWGFESQDSDYDVRFIYMHPQDWYLSVDLEHKRDVIEIPIDPVFDINGWDFRKALRLMKKSNPALMEWITSTIVYRQQDGFLQGMKRLMEEYYSPKACFYHYSHMALGNYRGYLKSESVRAKKYFYVLRPLLAMMWLERELGVVPIEFDILLETLLTEGLLKQDIQNLIVLKKAGLEDKYIAPVASINHFIETELERFSSAKTDLYAPSQSYERMNAFFREIIKLGQAISH